jgi:hypothetical protein
MTIFVELQKVTEAGEETGSPLFVKTELKMADGSEKWCKESPERVVRKFCEVL